MKFRCQINIINLGAIASVPKMDLGDTTKLNACVKVGFEIIPGIDVLFVMEFE